jgi:TonB family protein
MTRRTAALLVLALAGAAPAAAQSTPLAAARELYASARYDEALAVLNGLSPAESPSAVERRSVEQYRSLCLLALGRGSEADEAIAAVVTADPSYHPSEAEASPRVRAAFTEVRQRLLPDIARSRYTAAKAAFDRKEFADAEQQFRSVLSLIDDPDMGGRLGDLRVLVSGFLDLSTAAAAPPPPAPAPEPAPVAAPPAPVVASAPAPPPVDRIFTADDDGVSAPVIIHQDVPNVPAQIASQTRPFGLLEIVIDEQGRVVNATIRSPLHPVYDSQLLVAAQDWQYRPAMLDGHPVKFRKTIQVAVTR